MLHSVQFIFLSPAQGIPVSPVEAKLRPVKPPTYIGLPCHKLATILFQVDEIRKLKAFLENSTYAQNEQQADAMFG